MLQNFGPGRLKLASNLPLSHTHFLIENWHRWGVKSQNFPRAAHHGWAARGGVTPQPPQADFAKPLYLILESLQVLCGLLSCMYLYSFQREPG